MEDNLTIFPNKDAFPNNYTTMLSFRKDGTTMSKYSFYKEGLKLICIFTYTGFNEKNNITQSFEEVITEKRALTEIWDMACFYNEYKVIIC